MSRENAPTAMRRADAYKGFAPSSMDASGIVACKLAFEYPQRTLWSSLDFRVQAGEFLSVLGESGSGKSTLLACLASFERPTGGVLEIFGQRPARLRGSALRNYRRNVVGFVFQNSGVVASWTVRKNLEVGYMKIDPESPVTRAAFDDFGLHIDHMDDPVYQLSGGEQQRVGLIRAALRRTPLLLLDEPTSALDGHNTGLVREFIRRHCEAGGVAIAATHDDRLISAAHCTLHL